MINYEFPEQKLICNPGITILLRFDQSTHIYNALDVLSTSTKADITDFAERNFLRVLGVWSLNDVKNGNTLLPLFRQCR